MTAFRHMRLERDWEGVAWLALDRANERANTLSADMLVELSAMIDELEANAPNGLVILSGKEAGFVAGADIDEIEAVSDAAQARALVERGWNLFERIENLPFPTVALIRGHCMGGGLELALACRYRVVVDEPSTRLALPEVMLGLVPAWGGMRRLPLLVGPQVALDLMLTGRSLSARRAKAVGLADVCVPERVMENAARRVVMSGRHRKRQSFYQRVLSIAPLRRLVAAQARRKLEERVRREQYPAPYAILGLWAAHAGDVMAEPDESASSVAALLRSNTARNLLRVFRLRERLRRFGAEVEHGVRHVHVVGAGTMGGDIAALCADRGFSVSLQDTRPEAIAAAIGRAAKAFAARHRDDPLAVRSALDRLIPDEAGHGLRHADLVIEAIVEDGEAKRALFRQIEAEAPPQAMLATNTSSLLLEQIAPALAQPARLIGMHFFNPVMKMPLVEVVAGRERDTELALRALSFVRALDKLPLPVVSRPGFLVNAALAPYLFEALRCVEDGIAPAAVDDALRAFGMAVGPVELVDRIGLDVALAAGRALGLEPVPPRLAAAVAAGKLGRKSGEGYYLWRDDRPQRGKAEVPAPPRLAEGIVAPMIGALQEALAQGAVADADLADAALVFGAGFAPFTGGPLRWAENLNEEISHDSREHGNGRGSEPAGRSAT